MRRVTAYNRRTEKDVTPEDFPAKSEFVRTMLARGHVYQMIAAHNFAPGNAGASTIAASSLR